MGKSIFEAITWQVSRDFEKHRDDVRKTWHGYERDVDHWKEVDAKSVRDPIVIQRISNAFMRCPVNFNIFIWQSPERDYDRTLERNRVDDEWLHRVIGQDADDIISLKSSDSITIVMTNNLSDEYPISIRSPWMVAHRISHALGFRELSLPFDAFLQRVLAIGYDLEWPDTEQPYGQIIRDDYIEIYGKMMGHFLGTMNSARNQRLVQRVEWVHETFAQYVIKGQITLRPLPEHFDEGMDLTQDPKRRAVVMRAWENFPRQIEKQFSRVLDRAKGGVFVI